VAALPIAVVAAEAANTTPATRVETEATVFLAKKVEKKASVSPCHRSYLSSSLILLAPAIAGVALGQSVLITCCSPQHTPSPLYISGSPTMQ
jgi:hypothetical protein